MKKILAFLVALLAISGCTTTNKKPRRSSSFDEGSSLNTSSQESTSVNSEGTSASVSSQSSQPSSSPSSASSSTSVTPSGQLLGNYPIFDPPTNTPVEINTSTSTDDWWNNSLKTYMPENWDYLYGNNILQNGQFYANTEGGLKMDQHYKGFRTCLFHHTGPKLEIRFGISQYNEAQNKTPNKSVPTGYLFFFDKDGSYLSNLTYIIEHETIVPNKNEVKFYITGSGTANVAYFEFRLNDLTFKGDKCYNFGIDKVNVHSWLYE